MTILEAIQKLLTDVGIEPVYLRPIPHDKNTAVRLNGPYASDANEELTGLVRERYQCYTRAPLQTEADALSRRCFAALVDNYPQAEIEVNELIPLQGPTHIGADASGRHEYVFNIELVCWLKMKED